MSVVLVPAKSNPDGTQKAKPSVLRMLLFACTTTSDTGTREPGQLAYLWQPEAQFAAETVVQ